GRSLRLSYIFEEITTVCFCCFGCFFFWQFGHSLLHFFELRKDVHECSVFAPLFKVDGAIDQREERVVLPDAHVVARVEFSPSLPGDDLSCDGELSTEHFHAESFAFTIPSVVRATYTFFMCHE